MFDVCSFLRVSSSQRVVCFCDKTEKKILGEKGDTWVINPYKSRVLNKHTRLRTKSTVKILSREEQKQPKIRGCMVRIALLL